MLSLLGQTSQSRSYSLYTFSTLRRQLKVDEFHPMSITSVVTFEETPSHWKSVASCQGGNIAQPVKLHVASLHVIVDHILDFVKQAWLLPVWGQIPLCLSILQTVNSNLFWQLHIGHVSNVQDWWIIIVGKVDFFLLPFFVILVLIDLSIWLQNTYIILELAEEVSYNWGIIFISLLFYILFFFLYSIKTG